MKKLILYIIIFVTGVSHAHAYIDPFTGSFIIQALGALFTTIILWLGYPIRVFKKILNKILKKKKKPENKRQDEKI